MSDVFRILADDIFQVKWLSAYSSASAIEMLILLVTISVVSVFIYLLIYLIGQRAVERGRGDRKGERPLQHCFTASETSPSRWGLGAWTGSLDMITCAVHQVHPHLASQILLFKNMWFYSLWVNSMALLFCHISTILKVLLSKKLNNLEKSEL